MALFGRGYSYQPGQSRLISLLSPPRIADVRGCRQFLIFPRAAFQLFPRRFFFQRRSCSARGARIMMWGCPSRATNATPLRVTSGDLSHSCLVRSRSPFQVLKPSDRPERPYFRPPSEIGFPFPRSQPFDWTRRDVMLASDVRVSPPIGI